MAIHLAGSFVAVVASLVAYPMGAQVSPQPVPQPSNAIPDVLAASTCDGRAGGRGCVAPAVLSPRLKAPVGPVHLAGGAVPFVASGHGPNVPFAAEAGPLFLHRVTKAHQARIDAEVAQAAQRVRSARNGRP